MADIANIGETFTSFIPSSESMMGFLRNGLFLLGAVLLLGIVIFIVAYRKKNQNKGDMNEIGWWEEISDQLVPMKMDKAREIIIPGTSLRVFYIKNKDMWLPRFTRAVKQKLFYVAITPNKEIVNFTLKAIGKDMREAGLDYDHTDMRWAAENTKEFIKRNYRDKSTPWWKEFQGVITGAIYIIVVTFCLGIILYLWKGITDQQAAIMAEIGKQCMQFMGNAPTEASGVIQVP